MDANGPKNLIERFKRHEGRVVVVGIGYVGLPLVVEFAKAGFHVTGYDKDERKVVSLKKGVSYIEDIPTSELAPLVAAGRLTASIDESVIRDADAVIVCVPTPLNKTKEPDISYIVNATDAIVRNLHDNLVVVLESTTYPGTTRELVAPRLEAAGAKIGETLFLAFSPERVDPSNKKWGTHNTPKVLGGQTPRCLEVCQTLYSQIIEKVVPVSSTDAAEMVKLLENTFRAVNIGLVNEVAVMCNKLGLDVWEVIDAAASKPFGYMPFYPGPGLGGHCIPIDPLYLSWKLRTLNYKARFIDLASEVNTAMPEQVVETVAQALNDRERSVKGSKVFILGMAYKRDIDDVRESPAIDVMRLLEERGAKVEYHDPYIPEIRDHGHGEPTARGVSLTDERLRGADVVVIVTDHTCFDYAHVVKLSKLVVDTRNATKKLGKPANVVKL